MTTAFIGAGDDALGFALAGVEVIGCAGPDLAEDVLKAAALREDLDLLFVQAEIAAAAPSGIAALRRKHVPMLILEGHPS